MHFQFPQYQVEIVVRLGAGAEKAGRNARHRRRADAGAIPIQRRAGGKGDGVAFNDDRGRRAAGPVGALHAPADALHHPHILPRRQQRIVAGDHRLGSRGHLRLAHPAVNPQVAQGVVQAVNVPIQAESAAAESAGSVKNGVPVQKPPVVDGDAHLAGRLQRSVVINHHFRCRCHRQNLRRRCCYFLVIPAQAGI